MAWCRVHPLSWLSVSGLAAWHLSSVVDFLLMQSWCWSMDCDDSGMLPWHTDASHPPFEPIKTISPGYKKYCKEAMSHGIPWVAEPAPGIDTLLTLRHQESPQECCNDLSSLSDGLQSTQCMTISYNNPGPWWTFYSHRRPHNMQQGERIFQLGREIKWLCLHAPVRK